MNLGMSLCVAWLTLALLSSAWAKDRPAVAVASPEQAAAPNLVNKAGLPPSPFRTDRWEYDTGR